jgi:hypothetical protein
VTALTARAATGRIGAAETGQIALAETGQIAQPAGARPDDRITRRADQIARLANTAPERQVASGPGRAGTIRPARREAGSSGLPGGLAAAPDGTTAARGLAAARIGAPGRPAGPTPEDVATGPAAQTGLGGRTGPTVAGAMPSAATMLPATALRTSGWTFPSRLPRTSWIPKPQPNCGPCRETSPR